MQPGASRAFLSFYFLSLGESPGDEVLCSPSLPPPLNQSKLYTGYKLKNREEGIGQKK